MKKLIKIFTAVDVLGCSVLFGYAIYIQELFWWGMFAFSLTMVLLTPAKRIQMAMERKFLASKNKEAQAQTSGQYFPSQVGASVSPDSGPKQPITVRSISEQVVTAKSFKFSPRGYSVILNSPNKHNKLKPEHLNHAGATKALTPGALKISHGEIKSF